MISVEHVRPEQRQAYSGTTQGIAPRDKMAYWREVVCKNVVDLSFETRRDAPFDAALTGARLSDIAVSRICASPHDAVHTGSRPVRDNEDLLVFNFVLAGRMHVEQDGRSALLSVGAGTLCDATRPYVLHFDSPFEVACVTLCRRTLGLRTSSVGRTTATNFAQTSELTGIAFGYVTNLAQRAQHVLDFSTDRVSRNLAELLGAMVDEAALSSPLPLSEYRVAALLRVKDYLERHLSDSSLDSHAVATALKLSPRYINQLLEAEGTSLSRYIWRRRIERAAKDLRNPDLQSRTISTIALSNGFNDMGHFSKVFRQRFEASPREFRVASV